jgi:hypothetical protein
VIEHDLAASIDKVEKVLDGRDPEESLCGKDLLNVHLAQADVTNQTFTLKLADGIELLVPRHFRIDAVKLPEVDAFEPETPQAHQDALAQIFWAADRRIFAGTVTHQAALGRDQDASIRVQRFPEQLFTDSRAIAVRGVNEIDAKFRQAAQRAQRLGTIRRLPPDARAGDPHRAEPEAIDLDIAANRELACGSRTIFAHFGPQYADRQRHRHTHRFRPMPLYRYLMIR